jgi:hypothetical protein
MSDQDTLTPALSMANTLVTCDGGDASGEYRSGFLKAVAHLGLNATDGAQLAESLTGRSFASCGPADLCPVLEQLQVIAQRLQAPQSAPRRSCDE